MKRQMSAALESEVARILREAGVQFLENPAIGGVQPDFLVQSTDGRRYVLEVKGWASDPHHLARAVSQARLFQTATGADGAFVVLPNIEEGDPKRGFLALHEVAHWAAGDWSASSAKKPQTAWRGKKRGGQAKKAGRRVEGNTKDRQPIVFAAMPFSN